ncbi:MAG: hypothetical protein ABFE13_06045 [Phycisphaerales bacterium]
MEKRKKSRRRKLIIWLLIDLVVAALVISLLLHKPAGYRPVMPPAGADPNERRVPRYLTHDLGNTLYNGAQRQQPFEMIVLGNRLNEAIAQAGWLQESAGIKLSAPAIAFTSERVVLMGTADLEGAGFVITVEIDPQIAQDGRLNLRIEKVKIGVMNVTWLARKMGKKMYRERVAAGGVDPDDWRTKIAASLLNDEPLEPVLPLEDKWIRLKGLDVIEGRLTAQFVPAPPTDATD